MDVDDRYIMIILVVLRKKVCFGGKKDVEFHTPVTIQGGMKSRNPTFDSNCHLLVEHVSEIRFIGIKILIFFI